MRLFKVSLFVLAFAFVANSADARMVEGLQTSKKVAPADLSWEQVKTKVQNWWGEWRKPNERKPASESAAQKAQEVEVPYEQAAQPPAEQDATVDNWSTAPRIVAIPPQPAVKKGDSEATLKMKDLAKSVANKNVVRQVKPARPAAGNIPKTKSGVPTFSLFKSKSTKGKKGSKTVKIPVNEIPFLDVGQEESLVREDFMLDPVQIGAVEKRNFEKLAAPAILSDKDFIKILGKPVTAAKGPEAIKISALEEDQKVTTDKVQKIDYKVLTEKVISEVPTRSIGAEEMKFLRALILFEQKDKCHIAAGLFHDLAKDKNYNSSASFYLGVCLHKMGLFSESIDRLLEAIQGGEPEYVKRAVESLASELPGEFEVKVGKALEKVVETAKVDSEIKTQIYFIIAKGALKREKFAKAHEYANRIGQDHKLYRQAQYVMAIAEYATGQGATSLSRLEKLQILLQKKPDQDLSSLVHLNLGRVAFQEKKFKDASKHFLNISKGHPLWIQALTEQAWAQLMANDNEGAIGNMHSIQSPFFKSVYKPESYVVRTIGYLNLCQYPDAYRSLSRLEKEYRPWMVKMQNFSKVTKTPKDFYTTMAKYLSSPSSTEIGGLPYQVLREMGRHRDYLNIQESINHRIDEQDQYAFIKGLIKRDLEKANWLKSQAKGRLASLEAKIKASKNDEKLFKALNQMKQDRSNEQSLIAYYDFQIGVFEEGRNSLVKFEKKAKAKLAKLKSDLIVKAGVVLQKRLARMAKDLHSMFENNEFLRYEVFAGSGENIRHDLAGGAKRVPAHAKPTSKDLKWDFDGEFWEDEIGHYKSSLKDNCPKNQAQR